MKFKEQEKNVRNIAATVAPLVPGLGLIRATKMLATGGPRFVQMVRGLLKKPDNVDALNRAFKLTKRVGPPTGKGKNLVQPRFKKGPDGKPVGARPISKAAQKKAKQTRTAVATTAAGAAALALGPEKSKKAAVDKSKQVDKRKQKANASNNKSSSVSQAKVGSEYAPYPGAAGRAGFEYGRDIGEVLDDKTVPSEIKERLEEEELYEGDYKGGRVGKGKKMKMKKGGSPKGCGAAQRGYGKAMMGGGMVKTKRGYSGGGRLY